MPYRVGKPVNALTQERCLGLGVWPCAFLRANGPQVQPAGPAGRQPLRCQPVPAIDYRP
jgi:hypothetical protein